MKSLKKALAVLLSVLMVAFSFPLSALAVENPNNIGYAPGEEPFSTDYDVELHAFVMDYDGYDSYGFYSSTAGKTLDPKAISKADLASPDGVFCIYFTISGLDKVSSWQLTMPYDPTIITPAEYGRRDALSTGQDVPVLEDLTMYKRGASNGGYTMALNGADEMYFCTAMGSDTDNFDDETEVDVDCVLPGQVVACVGFQLLTDETVDLTKVIRLQNDNVGCQVETEFGINEEKYIVGYGATLAIDYPNWFGGPYEKGDPSPQTQFVWEEWGYAPEEEPSEVTYTYTFADGESTQVTAPAGEAPTAPENTANTACVSNEDGTHTYNTYSWPAWEDGTLEYKEIETPVTEDCNLEETEAAIDPVHADGESLPGKTAVMTCTECGYETGGEEIPAAEHVYSAEPDPELSTPATCVATGTNVYVCSVCGDTMEEEAPIDPDAHHVVTDEAVAATCTTSGLTEGSHCDLCSTVIVAQEEIPALGHDFSVQVGSSDATCVTPGTTTYKCSRCDETKVVTGEVNPNNHEGEVTLDQSTVKAATRGEDGYTGDYKCSACGAVVTEGTVIPALGVMITVEQNELGTTTLNREATTGEAQKVPYTENYTLVASPAADAEFIGWSVNGKLISTDATYTTAAYADLTYVPVFAEKTADFTVTFVDQFNMVLATMSSTEVAELEAMPETYDYLGYTFSDWSMSLEDVKALEANAVVTAYYAKDDALTYTVSAPGCVITTADGDFNDTAVVGFDEGVTVKPAEGTATAWTVNGNNAAYGAEYTFYVTSDVTVAFTSEEVTAAPTVAAVDVTPTDNGQVRFLATRNVPTGYTVLESGFVYGKDYADPEADLVLENATTGDCYLYKNSNTANNGQFALTFGIAAQTGTAYARAYVIAADAEGNAAVYYATVQSYDYGA